MSTRGSYTRPRGVEARERSRGVAGIGVGLTWPTAALGEMTIEKSDERSLLRRMREPAVRGVPARARQRDRVSFIEIPRDHDRVHVGFPANRRRVAELRGHEPHRHCDVALRLAFVAG